MRPVRYNGRWFFHPYPRFGRDERGIWGVSVAYRLVDQPALGTARHRTRIGALVKALLGRLS